MSTAFMLLAALSYLSRSDCFKFYVARDLTNTEELPKGIWSQVEVLGTKTESVTVKVDIPVAVLDSDVFIFFANDAKEILRVKLNETVSGSFYAVPHKLVKEMTAGETSRNEIESIRQISGTFPQSWLPKDFNKVSATVTTTDKKYYNYYGIQNYELAIPDLMVVEEFKKLEPK